MTLIGIDASRATSPSPTGTETYSLRLIQSLLRSSSHRFRLYLRRSPPADFFPGADLRVISFPRLWTHLRLSWEMARHPPDLLFVPAHVLPLLHPRLSLVTVHDLGYRRFPRAHPLPQRLYLELSTRWSSRAATHLLADSKATKADLVTYYGTPPAKVTVAYPGYDESLTPVRDPAAIAAVKQRYHVSGDYFLYLGTIQPRKNLARLIAAFAQLTDRSTTLLLAGKPGWLYRDLFAQVRRLGLENRVRFPGYVAQADKAALISGATAFVFPSLYEGFGLPVLEAQACGCPVICANSSSLPEVAGEGALLVDPTDTAALSAAMTSLLTDHRRRASLAERGLSNLNRFSWEECARTVLTVIDAILERSR